jgi:hypothetical protein
LRSQNAGHISKSNKNNRSIPYQRKEKSICHRILRGCKILRFLI